MTHAQRDTCTNSWLPAIRTSRDRWTQPGEKNEESTLIKVHGHCDSLQGQFEGLLGGFYKNKGKKEAVLHILPTMHIHSWRLPSCLHSCLETRSPPAQHNAAKHATGSDHREAAVALRQGAALSCRAHAQSLFIVTTLWPSSLLLDPVMGFSWIFSTSSYWLFLSSICRFLFPGQPF